MNLFLSDIGLITVVLDHEGVQNVLTKIIGDRGDNWRMERVPIKLASQGIAYKVKNKRSLVLS